MSDQVQRAARFAAQAHGGQKRKYTGEPYIRHPEAVATIVSTVTSDPEVLAAAWLHDVVEDTHVSLAEIHALFGDRIAQLVSDLTDVSVPSDGNRAIRKALDRDHLAQASPEAQTIKYADLIDNTRSIVTHDPAFARLYLREKAALLAVMDRGDPRLRKQAMRLCEESLGSLAPKSDNPDTESRAW